MNPGAQVPDILAGTGGCQAEECTDQAAAVFRPRIDTERSVEQVLGGAARGGREAAPELSVEFGAVRVGALEQLVSNSTWMTP
ncbi:hypothetical protein GCM10022380_18090 [Amycolatopsis tucumanensis]|uniref:Uncharacterized protein n=1 Tax=Amycolatopsis tucumanensis TaxID=401106 RepID=A0ABP7HR20_9PSEU